MSLSELCRLPVWNHKLSAHISVPWTRKNIEKTTKLCHRASKWSDPSCASLWLCEAHKSQRGRAGALLGIALAACRGLCISVLCKPHRFCSRERARERERPTAQLLGPLQTQLGTFTSAFFASYIWQEKTHLDLRLCNTQLYKRVLWLREIVFRKKIQIISLSLGDHLNLCLKGQIIHI